MNSPSTTFQTSPATTATPHSTTTPEVVEGERESVDINSLMDDAMNDTDEMVKNTLCIKIHIYNEQLHKFGKV